MPTFYGSDAVQEVQKREGPLTPVQKEIIQEEGFSTGEYKDDKGVSTSGVGQTGQFKGKSFKETYNVILEETRNHVPDFDLYPPEVKASLVSLAYRGDLQQSPTFRRLLQQGDYQKAAKELLNHSEYKSRKKKGGDGVTKRLEKAAVRIKQYGDELKALQNGT